MQHAHGELLTPTFFWNVLIWSQINSLWTASDARVYSIKSGCHFCTISQWKAKLITCKFNYWFDPFLQLTFSQFLTGLLATACILFTLSLVKVILTMEGEMYYKYRMVKCLTVITNGRWLTSWGAGRREQRYVVYRFLIWVFLKDYESYYYKIIQLKQKGLTYIMRRRALRTKLWRPGTQTILQPCYTKG